MEASFPIAPDYGAISVDLKTALHFLSPPSTQETDRLPFEVCSAHLISFPLVFHLSPKYVLVFFAFQDSPYYFGHFFHLPSYSSCFFIVFDFASTCHYVATVYGQEIQIGTHEAQHLGHNMCNPVVFFASPILFDYLLAKVRIYFLSSFSFPSLCFQREQKPNSSKSGTLGYNKHQLHTLQETGEIHTSVRSQTMNSAPLSNIQEDERQVDKIGSDETTCHIIS